MRHPSIAELERRVLDAAERFLDDWEDAEAVPDADELRAERELYDAAVALRAANVDAELVRRGEIPALPEGAIVLGEGPNRYDAGEHRKAREVLARRTWHVGVEGSAGMRSPVTFALVSGAVGDYAVYLGVGSPEWVAEHGDKLGFADAVALFPGLDVRRYRP